MLPAEQTKLLKILQKEKPIFNLQCISEGNIYDFHQKYAFNTQDRFSGNNDQSQYWMGTDFCPMARLQVKLLSTDYLFQRYKIEVTEVVTPCNEPIQTMTLDNQESGKPHVRLAVTVLFQKYI